MTERITDEQVAIALGWKFSNDVGYVLSDFSELGIWHLPPFTSSVDTAIKYLVPVMWAKGYAPGMSIVKEFYWAEFKTGHHPVRASAFIITNNWAYAMCESALQIIEKEKEDDR